MSDVTSPVSAAVHGIRWGRVILGALLVEVALFVVLIPVAMAVNNPFFTAADTTSTDFTTFFVAVLISCFAFGFLAAMWTVRPLTSRFALHGTLVGVIATAMYLGLGMLQPGGLPPIVAAYGSVYFYLAQGLRIAGAAAGASYQGTRRQRRRA